MFEVLKVVIQDIVTSDIFCILYKIQEFALTSRMNCSTERINSAEIGDFTAGCRNFNI